MRKFLFASAAAAALVASAIPTHQARAADINVFVGYADNLRASGFFPNPWLGAPGVVSQSPAGQLLDSGAIRLDNTTGSAITISNFSVHFPDNNSTFTIWNDLVIPAGGIGIFAENNGVDTQFDTSDFGIFGGTPPTNLEPNNAAGNGNTNLIGGCSSDPSFFTGTQAADCAAAVPVISFSVTAQVG